MEREGDAEYYVWTKIKNSNAYGVKQINIHKVGIAENGRILALISRGQPL